MAAVFALRERDGTLLGDIAGITYDKSIRRRLNRPSMVSFRVPSDHDLVWTIHTDGLPYLCAGYRQLMVTLDASAPDPFFNGVIFSLEDEGGEDISYTRVTALDPAGVYWPKRPARDPDGDFTDPTFIKDNITGPQIIQAIMDASENAGAGPPTDAEGDLFLDITGGTYEGGGVDLSGAPTNFPMSLMEIVNLMTSTGQVDWVIVPTDNGSEMGQLNVYNGDYGTDRTATVNFDYATGDFNALGLRRTEDMTDTVNKIWRYLGPRLDLQHWRANVTGNSERLPGNSLGGPGIGGAIPTSPVYAGGPLGDLIQDSRDGIGVLMEIQIQDNQGNESSSMPLHWRSWQMESLFRVNPRKTIYLTPTRDSPGSHAVGSFDVGDLVSINVGVKAREQVTNQVQRIYGYAINIDDDGVEALGELEASPDQEQV